jgi:multidrug efflux pump subunit AcrB
MQLSALCEQTRSELLQDGRITQIEVAGIPPPELSIAVSSEPRRRYDLTLEEIARRVDQASIDLPGESSDTPAGEVLLRTTEERELPREFGRIIVASRPDGTQVRLDDRADHRYLTLAIAASLLAIVAGVVLSGRVPFSCLPRVESDVITASIELPFGTAPRDTERAIDVLTDAARATARVLADGALLGVYAETGITVPSGGPDAARIGGEAGAHLAVRTPDGGEIPMSQAARIRRERSATQIERTDGRRTIEVTADVRQDVANAGQIMAALEQSVLPELGRRHPGLTYSRAGEQEEQAEVGAPGRGMSLALFAMYASMAAAFRSCAQPILVILAIPFGLVGAVLGHLAMGFHLLAVMPAGYMAMDDGARCMEAWRARRRGQAGHAEKLAAVCTTCGGGTPRAEVALSAPWSSPSVSAAGSCTYAATCPRVSTRRPHGPERALHGAFWNREKEQACSR